MNVSRRRALNASVPCAVPHGSVSRLGCSVAVAKLGSSHAVPRTVPMRQECNASVVIDRVTGPCASRQRGILAANTSAAPPDISCQTTIERESTMATRGAAADRPGRASVTPTVLLSPGPMTHTRTRLD